jgi:hypothetical protein
MSHVTLLACDTSSLNVLLLPFTRAADPIEASNEARGAFGARGAPFAIDV